MSLLQLGQVIFGGTPRIIAYLRQNNLLAATMDCTRYEKMHHVLLRKSMHVGVQTLPWLSGQGMMYLTGLVGIAHSATQEKASEKIAFLTNLD